MGLDYSQRREFRQNGFTYLLDDNEKTAWIKEGHIGRGHRYRLPDHVFIGGERYTIESAEMGCYNRPRTLKHLVIPDSFIYVDEDCFYRFPNLRSVHIGKGVKYISHWHCRNCPKLSSYVIDKDNPHLTIRDGMIMTKDGKKVLSEIRKHTHLVIPEGVEEIASVAFWYNDSLESVTYPSTLRKIGDNSFSNCPKLRSVVLPEGFKDCVVQSFMENNGLELIDFPSTLTHLGWGTFSDCPNLKTVILRMPTILKDCEEFDIPLETCRLMVPAHLVESYRQHPEWGKFQNIIPINENDNNTKK